MNSANQNKQATTENQQQSQKKNYESEENSEADGQNEGSGETSSGSEEGESGEYEDDESDDDYSEDSERLISPSRVKAIGFGDQGKKDENEETFGNKKIKDTFGLRTKLQRGKITESFHPTTNNSNKPYAKPNPNAQPFMAQGQSQMQNMNSQQMYQQMHGGMQNSNNMSKMQQQNSGQMRIDAESFQPQNLQAGENKDNMIQGNN